MNEEEGQKPPQQQYNVGDVVGGWRLGPDGQWHSALPDPGIQEKDSYPRYVPRPAPEPKGMSTGAKIAIGLGAAFGGILLIGVLGAAFGAGNSEPEAAPEPATTVTETAPTPTPTPTTDPDDAVRDTSEYRLVQTFMDTAMRKSGSDIDYVCLEYNTNPAKYNGIFTKTAMKTGMFSYEVVAVAVSDWFTEKCGGA